MNPRFRLFASSSFQPDCAKRMFAEQALMPKGLGNTGLWYLAAHRYLVSRSPWTGLCGGLNQSNSASLVDLTSILSRDSPDVGSRDNTAGAGGAR